MQDFTNYVYFTIYFSYLLKDMSISFTRTVTFPDPASLSAVSAFAEFHVSDYDDDDGESPLSGMALRLAQYLPTGQGRVQGVRALAFREGATVPIVWSSDRQIDAAGPSTATRLLPTYMAVAYSASTNVFRRNGPRFSLPIVNEDYVTGNTVTAAYDTSPVGKDFGGPGLSFLGFLNAPTAWDEVFGSATQRSVVKRVPNLPPEGSGSGDRLPSYIVDPVSAVLANAYTYKTLATTQNLRKF